MKPRLVFMGTPPFSIPSLEACLELAEVVAVVTQPDKPRGRGQELSFSAIKTRALELGLPVMQPEKIRGTDFAEALKALAPDAAVVTAYGKILPQDVLSAPRRGCLNIHASLLPRFRGAAPIQRAIAAGDSETGVCLMVMDVGMDTGPVISSLRCPILPSDTSASLHDKLSVLGGQLLKSDLLPFLSGTLQAKPQSAEGVAMAPMLKKEEGLADFKLPASALERQLRAFTPWPGLYTYYCGKILKLLAVEVAAGKGEPGAVLSASTQGIEIACRESSLLVKALQPEGKRAMQAGEFLASRKIEVGTKPFGPSAH